MSAIVLTQMATQTQAKGGRLSVQVVAGIVICSDCHGGYASQRSARNHLEQEHGVDANVAKSQARSAFSSLATMEGAEHPHPLRTLYREAPAPTGSRFPDGKLPPIEGVSVVVGYQCPKCMFCAKSVKTMKNHFKEHRSGELDGGKLSAKGTIMLQSLFGGSATKFFPVTGAEGEDATVGDLIEDAGAIALDPSQGAVDEGADCGVAAEAVPGAEVDGGLAIAVHDLLDVSVVGEVKGATDGGSVDRRLMNDFVDRMEFDTILKDEGMSLAQAVSLVERPQSEAERRLGKDVTEYFSGIPKMRREVAPCLIGKISVTRDGEFQVVSSSASERYAREVTKVLLAALRLLDSRYVGAEARDALRRYLEAASGGSENRVGLLHQVMVELFLCILKPYEKPSGLFVRLFIACSSVCEVFWNGKSSGAYRFREAAEMSPVLAALLYTCSSTAIYELYCVAEESAHVAEVGDRSRLDARVNHVLGSMDVESNTAASYVRFVMNVCMDQMRMKTVGTKFVECNQHRCCGYVDGVEVSLRLVGGLVRKWQGEVDVLLNTKLLFGANLPDGFQSELAAMEDMLTERGNGFNFMLHPRKRGWVQKMVKWLLSSLSDAPMAKATLFAGGSEGEDVVNIGGSRMSGDGVRKWLQACQKVQEALLACVHFASGSPARATEIGTYSLRNTAWNVRSLFVSQGEVVVVARYSKKRKLTGGDRPIARFPDAETNRLLLTYLVLIRPVESVFVGALHGQSAQAGQWESLFAERGVRYDAVRIRAIIKDRLHGEGVPLGFGQFRDFSAAMVRTIGKQNGQGADGLWEEFQAVGHLQAGHMVTTADNNYGRSEADVDNLGATELARYRSWALLLHREMGLASVRSSDVVPNTVGPTTAGSTNLLDSAIIGQCRDEIVTGCVESFTTTLGKRLRETGDGVFPSVSLSAAGRPGISGISESATGTRLLVPPYRSRDEDAHIYLRALRSALGDERATFKSQMQADVVAAVREGKQDMFVVMPTGGGKTLCFLLPVFMEGMEKCTVVVTPLVSLRNEVISRAQALGLSVGNWSDRKREDVQVLVLSAEHIEAGEFHVMLRELVRQKRLARIVVDEVHLTILWAEFRPSLKHMQYMLQTVQHNVQRVLLTATAPLEDREPIMSAHGLRLAVLYSMPTVRKNLRFRVRVVETKMCQASNGAQCQALLDEVQESCAELSTVHCRVIIFVQRKADIELIKECLFDMFGFGGAESGVLVLSYHGSMEDGQKAEAHAAWMRKESCSRVMVCTNAFGTGLDTPDVRTVIHYTGSGNLLEYAQEAGRAGRDGKPAECIYLYSPAFAGSWEKVLTRSGAGKRVKVPDEARRSICMYQKLCDWAANTTSCRKNALYCYLDGQGPGLCVYDPDSVCCDVCEKLEGGGRYGERAAQVARLTGTELNRTLVSPITPSVAIGNDGGTGIRGRSSAGPVVVRRLEMEEDTIRPNGPQEGTVAINKASEVLAAEEGMKYLQAFTEIGRRLDGICIRTLVSSDGKSQKKAGSHHAKSCYVCHGPHFVRKCTVDRYQDGMCYKCDLRFLHGFDLHEKVSRNECTLGCTRDLAWIVWQFRTVRQCMVKKLMSVSDREEIGFEICRNTNMYVLRPVAGQEELTGDQRYSAWLRRGDPVRNQVKVVMWWGTEYKFIQD